MKKAILKIGNKEYKQTEKQFTLNNLFQDANGEECPTKAIWRFASRFLDAIYPYNKVIDLDPFSESKSRMEWIINGSFDYIIWLVDNDYFKSIKKEKQKSNQWYKANESDNLYYSAANKFELVCMKVNNKSNVSDAILGSRYEWDEIQFTVIHPPQIIEQD